MAILSSIVAKCHIVGIAPLTQSRPYEVPYLEGETPDQYDARNWRQHAHIAKGTLRIPASAMHKALASAAKYSKRQIPNQGRATWTRKFEAGIALFQDIDTGISEKVIQMFPIYANPQGKKDGGTRVLKRLPQVIEWEAEFEVRVLDPIISEDVFTEMLEIAGMFVGVGQYRPEKGGTNGRWRVESVEWQAERQPDRGRNRRARAA